VPPTPTTAPRAPPTDGSRHAGTTATSYAAPPGWSRSPGTSPATTPSWPSPWWPARRA